MEISKTLQDDEVLELENAGQRCRGADAACLFAAPDNAPMCGLLDKLGYIERRDRRFSYVLKVLKP